GSPARALGVRAELEPRAVRLCGAQPRRREARRVRERRDLRALLHPRNRRAARPEAAPSRGRRRRPVEHLPDDRGPGAHARGLRARRDPAPCGRRRLTFADNVPPGPRTWLGGSPRTWLSEAGGGPGGAAASPGAW